MQVPQMLRPVQVQVERVVQEVRRAGDIVCLALNFLSGHARLWLGMACPHLGFLVSKSHITGTGEGSDASQLSAGGSSGERPRKSSVCRMFSCEPMHGIFEHDDASMWRQRDLSHLCAFKHLLFTR